MADVSGRPRVSPHALVADVETPVLEERERHHFERVLRVRHGDALTVGDGAGRWRQCVMGSPLEVVGEIVFEPRPEPEVAVGFAVLKGGRSDRVVRQLTELGVDRIVPFVAERSVVRLNGSRAQRVGQRWRRVAREAVMQCRRSWLPAIELVVDLEDLAGRGAALAASSGRRLGAEVNFVLVGPEGGWVDSEMSLVPEHVGLGPNILRAETAAIAVATLLTARRSGCLPAPTQHR